MMSSSEGFGLNRAAVALGETVGDGGLDSELSDLLRELEESGDVRLALGGERAVPRYDVRSATGEKGPASGETIPEARVPGRDGQALVPAVVYRDKDDVRTILSQTWVMKGMLLLVIASFTGNVFQYLRRPDRIVVDGGTGRVLSINDRNYGREEGVEFGPDRLTSQDKLYITREFVRAFYQIDPATRNRDVERALTMMVPDSAKKFAVWLREKGVLDQQKKESWQAIWTPQDVSVDQNDPYTVNVIGKQDITKVVSGAAAREVKQLRITIKLVADNKGRADRNLRSGFLVSYVDMRELNESSPAGAGQGAATTTATTAAAGAPGGSNLPVTSEISPVTALQDETQLQN